jgi:hypothetical protein
MPHPPHETTVAGSTGQLSLEERVHKRAYELYVLRGNESGSEIDDWLQAEDEIQEAAEQNAKRK